jgi:hypothetical protein
LQFASEYTIVFSKREAKAETKRSLAEGVKPYWREDQLEEKRLRR